MPGMVELRTVVVTRKWREAEDIYGFALTDAGGGELTEFAAGSHIDVSIPNGPTRQYSLVRPYAIGLPYEIAVLREPHSRGGSRVLCDSVREGDRLEISEPRNCFPLLTARHSVLLAGGIGITPILCMAETLQASGQSYEMHYCARTAARMAFRARMAGSALSSRIFFHLDDGEAGQKLDITNTLADPASDKHLYVCGPGAFLDHVRGNARELGWSSDNVHFEYFAAPTQSDVSQAMDATFEVVVSSTGLSVVVGAKESITAALARCGVDVPVMCEQGVCGSCLTNVLEGVPDHRDYVLTDDERASGRKMLPCCSRALSGRLVLEL